MVIFVGLVEVVGEAILTGPIAKTTGRVVISKTQSLARPQVLDRKMCPDLEKMIPWENVSNMIS